MPTTNPEPKEAPPTSAEVDRYQRHCHVLGVQTLVAYTVAGVPYDVLAWSSLYQVLHALKEIAHRDPTTARIMADKIAEAYLDGVGDLGLDPGVAAGGQANGAA